MARVKDPLFSNQAAGRCGGVVYIRRGTSTVARAYNAAPRVPSQAQLDILAMARTCTQGWKNLTADQRAQWEQYAAIYAPLDWASGEKMWSGQNAYTHCGMLRIRHGGSPAATPPFPFDVILPFNYYLSQTIEGIVLHWTPMTYPDYSGAKMEFWAAGPHSPGLTLKPAKCKYQLAGSYTTGDLTWTPPDLGFYTVAFRVVAPTRGVCSTFATLTIDFQQ